MRVLFLLLFSLCVRCQYLLCGWERPHHTSYGDTQVSSRGYMITSWHGNAFRITSHLWRESSDHRRLSFKNGPVMRSFDVPFVVGLNKLFTKHSSCRLFETPWRSWDATLINMSRKVFRHFAVLFFCFVWGYTINYSMAIKYAATSSIEFLCKKMSCFSKISWN